jgi:6,7-dimethyl-8-ribityllumazine synthase
MATQGNITLNEGIPTIKDAFVVIVKTDWNAKIVDELANGCEKVFQENHISYETLTVPGAVELPFAVKAWDRGAKARKADAYIVFGTVIKGGTPHFEYVCKIVSEGVTQLNLELTVPTIFGVLTVNTEEQAIERIGGKEGHKGEEAGITAIKMIDLNRKLGNK